MLQVHRGLVRAKRAVGDRVAFIVDKGSVSKIKKTVFVFDGEYEADDDDDEKFVASSELSEPSSSATLSSGELIPPEILLQFGLSSFNLELFKRIMKTGNFDMVSLADPTTQKHSLQKAIAISQQYQALKTKGLASNDDEMPEGQQDFDKVPLTGEELQLSPEDSEIIIPASSDSTFRIAVAGRTGVGKSRWVAQYCEIFRREHPWNAALEKRNLRKKRNPGNDSEDDVDESHTHAKEYNPKVNYRINIFSFFDHDPAYDGIEGLFYIKLDENLLEGAGLMQDMFKHSLCVFDDIEALNGGPLKNILVDFRSQCLTTGRKKEISTVSVIHETFAGIDTRPCWKESEGLVIFPRADTANIFQLLERKYRMPKTEIAFILGQKTRAVYIKTSHPRVMITRTKIKVLT